MCVFPERGVFPEGECTYFSRNTKPGSPFDGTPGARILRMPGAILPYIVEDFVFRVSSAQVCPATAVNTAVFHSLCFSLLGLARLRGHFVARRIQTLRAFRRAGLFDLCDAGWLSWALGCWLLAVGCWRLCWAGPGSETHKATNSMLLLLLLLRRGVAFPEREQLRGGQGPKHTTLQTLCCCCCFVEGQPSPSGSRFSQGKALRCTRQLHEGPGWPWRGFSGPAWRA